MTTRYFEDFAPGQRYELGTHQMTAEEIIDFARRFDPQPFHVDPDAAVASPFGGLIASGWHSAAVFMRLYVDTLLADSTSMGSPGIEQLRWRRPVRPGDVLSGRFDVEDVMDSTRRADRGTVLFVGTLTNQDGEAVLTMRGRGYFGRRNPA
ncbi:MAG TPA: MaoC family dehydratase [Egibacteraceae bacterium]|nr:MaoC family dehydratase [Egibacteraceae bacterium]